MLTQSQTLDIFHSSGDADNFPEEGWGLMYMRQREGMTLGTLTGTSLLFGENEGQEQTGIIMARLMGKSRRWRRYPGLEAIFMPNKVFFV